MRPLFGVSGSHGSASPTGSEISVEEEILQDREVAGDECKDAACPNSDFVFDDLLDEDSNKKKL